MNAYEYELHRMKRIAREWRHKPRNVFYKYLLSYGWTQEQVDFMWEYAQKGKDKGVSINETMQ